MKLIVGLGNPGFKYSKTRHNIGFRVVDSFAKQNGVRIKKKEKKSLTGSFYLQQEKILLAKPQTYMNKSGDSVRELADWYQINHSNIVVIYDDLDLSPGTLRIRKAGGHGGHKGLKSIFNNLATKEIPRIRIGIGRPPEYMTVSDYVLGKFKAEQRKLIDKSISEAVLALETILTADLEQAMNDYN